MVTSISLTSRRSGAAGPGSNGKRAPPARSRSPRAGGASAGRRCCAPACGAPAGPSGAASAPAAARWDGGKITEAQRQPRCGDSEPLRPCAKQRPRQRLQIIDASVIEARRPRLTRTEKATIREGSTPAGWSKARTRQIDRDRRWTIKRGKKASSPEGCGAKPSAKSRCRCPATRTISASTWRTALSGASRSPMPRP